MQQNPKRGGNVTRRQLPQREHQQSQTKNWEPNGVVIVANRLPVERRPDGTLARSPGGLASALASVASDRTHWIGWAGAEASESDLGDEYLHPVELRPR